MKKTALLLLAACATVPPPPPHAPPAAVEATAPEAGSNGSVSQPAHEAGSNGSVSQPAHEAGSNGSVSQPAQEPEEPAVALPEPRPEDEDLPPPGDLMEFLYGGRLNFAEGGIPLVSIRVVEGTDEIRFIPRGALRIRTRGGKGDVSAQAGGEWRVTVSKSRPAVIEHSAVIDERPAADRESIARLADEWRDKGVATRTVAVGNLYGVAGRVLDARRTFLVVDTDGSKAAAEAAARDLLERFLTRPVVVKVLVKRPEGKLTLWAPSGAPVAESEGALEVAALGGRGITVRDVAYGVFIGPRGSEDRTYGGRVLVAVDGEGKLAAVNALPLEKLLRGILPAEIFASAPLEALKAQAVAARGETLFAPRGGALVDAVYSAVCGGHSENNEVVWGGAANPSLRGVPDFDAARVAPRFARGITDVGRFVAADIPAFCRLSRFARASKFRWERRFTEAQVDEMVAELGVGSVQRIEVESRGVSGRASSVRVVGKSGTARIKGELNIRRRFGTLNSAMFEVTHAEGEAGSDGSVSQPAHEAGTDGSVSQPAHEWIFRGGGWGHGVGMCQLGAMGRAERGQGYRTILAHYFNGAEVVRIYDAAGPLAESSSKPK